MFSDQEVRHRLEFFDENPSFVVASALQRERKFCCKWELWGWQKMVIVGGEDEN